MYKKELLDGRVLAHSNDYLYIAKEDPYIRITYTLIFTKNFCQFEYFNSNSLLQRFFRSGFHHVSCMKDKILLFVDKEIYYIYKNDDIKYLGEIKGCALYLFVIIIIILIMGNIFRIQIGYP